MGPSSGNLPTKSLADSPLVQHQSPTQTAENEQKNLNIVTGPDDGEDAEPKQAAPMGNYVV